MLQLVASDDNGLFQKMRIKPGRMYKPLGTMLNPILSNLHHKTVKGKIEGPRLLIKAYVHRDEFKPMETAMKINRSLPNILYKENVIYSSLSIYLHLN